MKTLAIFIVVIFALLIIVGPLGLYLALHDKSLAASILGAVSLLLGGHWYLNVTSPPRYLGALSVAFGLAALCVVLSRL